MPKDELSSLVEKSSTFAQILAAFGLQNKGGNGYTLKQRLNHDNISFTHITSRKLENQRKGLKHPPVSNDKLFIENSIYGHTTVRRHVIKYNLKPYVCAICGLQPFWNGKSLPLILDHINGKNNDHRLNNLRFICPNCEYQTETHGSKNYSAGRVHK